MSAIFEPVCLPMPEGVCLFVSVCVPMALGFPLEKCPDCACDCFGVCLSKYLSVCVCMISWYLHVTLCLASSNFWALAVC